VVARFNGGANAGHTVLVGDKKFAFHLLPCGIIYPHTTNLLGNGTVVHVPSLFAELKDLDAAGVPWTGRLKISDRAHVLFDFHKRVDGLMEERRSASGGGGKIGTTKQGIGPCYASKAARNGIRFGMLAHPESLRARLSRLIADTREAFQVDIDEKEEQAKMEAWRARVLPWVVDGVALVNGALDQGKRVITEGANAALLDVDFGTYPYVTSSSTSAGGVCTGLGIAPSRIEAVVGVVKAYTTRVGGGPFPTELTDERGGGDRPLNAPGTEEGLHLQRVGREVGVTTGRKRRCGWFDAVVVRYAHTLNGFTSLNLTKLDVLDDMATLRLGVAYKLRGQVLPPGTMPSTLEDLAAVEVVYEGAPPPPPPPPHPPLSWVALLPFLKPPNTPYNQMHEDMPGWKTSTQGVTEFSKLPKEARAYIKRIEQVTGVPIAWVGTGPKRSDMMARGFSQPAQ
jgi:adenylosuccinate synthase